MGFGGPKPVDNVNEAKKAAKPKPHNQLQNKNKGKKPLPLSSTSHTTPIQNGFFMVPSLGKFKDAITAIIETKSIFSDVLMRIVVHPEKERALGKSYKTMYARCLEVTQKELDPHFYLDRVLGGIEKLSTFEPDYSSQQHLLSLDRFMGRFTENPDYIFAFYIGSFGYQAENISPGLAPRLNVLENYLRDYPQHRADAYEALAYDNLRFALSALQTILQFTLQTRQALSEARQKAEREKTEKIRAKFMEWELEQIHKDRERAIERIQERAEAEKPQAIKELIEIGKIIEEVKSGVEKQDGESLYKVIYKIIHRPNGKIKIEIAGRQKVKHETSVSEMLLLEIKNILAAEPEKALPILIDAAARLKTDSALPVDGRARTVKAVRQLVRDILIFSPRPQVKATVNHDQVQKLVSRLIEVYQEPQKVEAPLRPATIELIINILRKMPEALPSLIQAHARHQSALQRTIARLLEVIGMKPRNVAQQALAPLIQELARTPQGRDQILNYVFLTLSQEDVYSRSDRNQLKALEVDSKLLKESVRKILAEVQSLSVNTFEEKDRPQELKELLGEFAKKNKVRPSSSKLWRTKFVKKLLAAVTRLQQFTELVRENKLGWASTLLEKPAEEMLPEHSQRIEAFRPEEKPYSLHLPAPELVRALFDGENYKDLKPEKQDSYWIKNKQNPIAQLDYHIVKSTNGNIPAAQRVKEVLHRQPEVIKAIQQEIRIQAARPSHPPETEKEAVVERVRIDSLIRYAYCFLALQHGAEEKDIARDLEAALALDNERKDLYLSMRILPDVVKSQLQHHRFRSLRDRIQEIIIFTQSGEDQ